MVNSVTFNLRISVFLTSFSSFNSDTRCSRETAEALQSAISCSCDSNNFARFVLKLGGVLGLYETRKKTFKLLNNIHNLPCKLLIKRWICKAIMKTVGSR